MDILYDASSFIESQQDKWTIIWLTLILGVLVSNIAIYWYLRSVIQEERSEIATVTEKMIGLYRQHLSDAAVNINVSSPLSMYHCDVRFPVPVVACLEPDADGYDCIV